MRKHNFIKNWLPVLALAGIGVVVALSCLIAWLVSDRTPDSRDTVTQPSGYTSESGQTTTPTDAVTTAPTQPPATTQPTQPPQQLTPQQKQLSCDKIAMFSGRFVEDGSGRPVEDVAVLLVTNRTEKFLDMATIQYEIDGQKGTFIVTGLPAGKSCWVMEYTAKTITDQSTLKYVGCSTSFREDAVNSTDKLTVSADGNILSAVNPTDETLKNVVVYYKNVQDDGNYLGGITYMVTFGDIAPGETVSKLGGHYKPGESEIVRLGWLSENT